MRWRAPCGRTGAREHHAAELGPEYLFDGKQITRVGLEDHFCGELLGLLMGVDVCYTNHAEADQDDMYPPLTLLAMAGVTFVITVPGAEDIMLNYQSTSHHDADYVRQVLGRRPAPEFEAWLRRAGIVDRDGRLPTPSCLRRCDRRSASSRRSEATRDR